MSNDLDVVALIREKDTFAHKLGIEIIEAANGASHVTMQLDEGTANALGNAHGGVISLLPNLAFAAACNSEGVISVGVEVSIQYLSSCLSEGRLDARATKVRETKRLAFYKLEVFTPEDEVIAVAQALAYRKIKG